MLRSLLLLLFLAVARPPLPAQAPAAVAAALDDGPYVLWQGPEARILRVRDGRLEEARKRGPFRLELPGMAPEVRLDSRPPAAAAASFPMPAKLLAVSDLHGNLRGFRELLAAHGVADADGQWRFSRGHLVVVGDVFDRGPEVTAILWLLRSLEAQAVKAGGRVHLVLGNHEAMVLRGDLRYLHPKYARLQGVLPASLPELYGPGSELGRWLRTRPALLKIGPYLFVHGGISEALLDLGHDLGGLNAALRRALDAPADDAAAHRLLGEDGPLWHRGFVPGARKAGDAPEALLERALRTFRARALVVGHTTVERVTALHGGRVYAIDAGLKQQGVGEAWIAEGGRVFRGLADGRREPLAP